jgi:uncharacterized protein YndB with AHSA1/START domain
MGRQQHDQTQPKPATGQASLTLTRHIKAPPQRVFAAWTQPEALKVWFGPSDDYELVVSEVDLRVGGAYRLVLKSPADKGETHGVSGVYRTIEPNKVLAFTWAWQSTPERVSLVTVTFAEKDGGTWLTLTHEQLWDDEVKARHEHGWTGSMDRLTRAIDKALL